MYTRTSPMDILARKSARRTKVRGQVGEQADCRARRTRRLSREDPRAEVGEEVRVGVGVRVGPVEFKLNTTGLKASRLDEVVRVSTARCVHHPARPAWRHCRPPHPPRPPSLRRCRRRRRRPAAGAGGSDTSGRRPRIVVVPETLWNRRHIRWWDAATVDEPADDGRDDQMTHADTGWRTTTTASYRRLHETFYSHVNSLHAVALVRDVLYDL